VCGWFDGEGGHIPSFIVDECFGNELAHPFLQRRTCAQERKRKRGLGEPMSCVCVSQGVCDMQNTRHERVTEIERDKTWCCERRTLRMIALCSASSGDLASPSDCGSRRTTVVGGTAAGAPGIVVLPPSVRLMPCLHQCWSKKIHGTSSRLELPSSVQKLMLQATTS